MLDFLIIRAGDLAQILIVAHIVIGFVPDWKRSELYLRMSKILELAYRPIRDVLPTYKMGLDFSPIVLILIIKVAVVLLTAIF
jgi:uncharacterized protein YggT (Ycf19 family)